LIYFVWQAVEVTSLRRRRENISVVYNKLKLITTVSETAQTIQQFINRVTTNIRVFVVAIAHFDRDMETTNSL
jgi:hypothetical protein